MLGFINQQDPEVAVIGGGIAGLLAAYFLDQKGYMVHLFETQDRVGGMIRSTYTGYGKVEWAAHSVLATPAVEALCRDLEVGLLESHEKARYILRNEKMRRFPLRLGEGIEALYRACFMKASGTEELQSLGDWTLKHLGKGALDYFMQPFVQGIYGVDAFEVLQEAAFPFFHIQKRSTLLKTLLNNKKQKRPYAKVKAPVGGMGMLVDALGQRLKERLKDRYHLKHSINALPQFGNIVLATPAFVAGGLLESEDTLLSHALKEVRYIPLVSVTAFLPSSFFRKKIKGVGVLIPENEKNRVLGVLFHSKNPLLKTQEKDPWCSFTLIFGGSREPEVVDETDESLRTRSWEELELLFGWNKTSSWQSGRVSDDFYCSIIRWKQALPVYNKKLVDAWDQARLGWCSKPGRILFGNYTGKISLRGMIETMYFFK